MNTYWLDSLLGLFIWEDGKLAYKHNPDHQSITITGSDVPIGCGLIILRVRVNEIEFWEPGRRETGQGLCVWLNHI